MPERGSRPPGPAELDDDFLYYLRIGSELVHQGRADEGRVALERALALRPDHTKALNLLALAYFKLGFLDRARQIYSALAEAYPHEPALFVNLGLVLLREARLDDAERALRTALMMAPDHTRAHCYLGMVLYRRGELVQAREHFIRGDAVEFARRLEARIAEGRASWSTIRKIAEDGVQTLSTDATALRSMGGEGRADIASDARRRFPAYSPGSGVTTSSAVTRSSRAATPSSISSVRRSDATPSVSPSRGPRRRQFSAPRATITVARMPFRAT